LSGSGSKEITHLPMSGCNRARLFAEKIEYLAIIYEKYINPQTIADIQPVTFRSEWNQS